MKLQALQYLFRGGLQLTTIKEVQKQNCYSYRYQHPHKRCGYQMPRYPQGGNKESDSTVFYFISGLTLGAGVTYAHLKYPKEVCQFKQCLVNAFMKSMGWGKPCRPGCDPCEPPKTAVQIAVNEEPVKTLAPGTCVELSVMSCGEPSDCSHNAAENCSDVRVPIDKEANCESDDDRVCQPNKNKKDDDARCLQISIEDNGSEKVYDIIFIEEDDNCKK